MSNIKKSTIVLSIIFSFLSVPFVHAEGDLPRKEGRGDFGKMREWRGKKMQEIYSQLNLTEDQKKLLDENKVASKERMKSSFEKMRPLRDTLNQELMKADLDMNRINEIQSQLKAIQSEIGDSRLTSILEVRKILTPEQFAKFISLMDKKKKERFGKDN